MAAVDPSVPISRLGRRSRAAGRGLRPIREALIQGLCLGSAVLSIFVTLGILLVLVGEAVAFFSQASPIEFFFTSEWAPNASDPKFGVLPLLVGTGMIMVGSGIISIPLGLLCAVFLSEYCPPAFRKVLKPALELLAGVPSVVYGFLALFTVTPLLQQIIPGLQGQNALAGMIVVGIMTLPLVTSLCEDAISAVPQSLREGAFGLGSTKFEVIRKIVLPSAFSGIVAAFILALSRAVGEVMAVTLAAGATPRLTFDPTQAVQTMTAYIVNTSKGDMPRGTIGYQTVFAVGLTLFVVTFGMNWIAQRMVRKYRRAY